MNTLYPDRVRLGPDGVYRWKTMLSREQAFHNFKLMVGLGAAVATVVCAIAFIMFCLEAGGSMTFREFLLFPLILYGGIVGLPALIGFLTLNWDTRSYEMDEKGIRHKHATKGGDAYIEFQRVKWMAEEGSAVVMKQGITTYTVYIPAENADFVKAFVKERIRNARAVH